MYNILPAHGTTPSVKLEIKGRQTKGQAISGYSHILSELITGLGTVVSGFFDTITFNNQAIYNLKLNLFSSAIRMLLP